ncbi:MAG: tetratricopeptide repeat protein [Desulfovibrio sp.]|jgi:Tfp pilus assembly protein PilF|nr:tetratricopeptide repeat protein [Desulfovibrio sp.]
MTRNRLLIPLVLALGIAAVGCAMPRISVYDDPLSAKEHLQLGMANESKGDLEAAASEYRQAMHREPLARLYLGNVYYGQGRLQDAEGEYRAALERLPENPEIMNNLAWVLLRRGVKLEEAQDLAERAVSRAPNAQAATAYQDTLSAIRAARAVPK